MEELEECMVDEVQYNSTGRARVLTGISPRLRSATSGTDRAPRTPSDAVERRRLSCRPFVTSLGAMAPAWERARRALATRFCMHSPARHVTVDDAPRMMDNMEALFPVAEAPEEETVMSLAAPASAGRVSGSWSRSSAKMCAICLGGMRSGHGQALFTAECSHKFHFHCITSNVQHGNKICPICRALWKELPFQGPHGHGGSGRVNPNPTGWPHSGMLTGNNPLDELPVFRPSEVAFFNDDEPIDDLAVQSSEAAVGGGECPVAGGTLEITTYTEFPAIQETAAQENFAILIHLNAPHASASASARAPLDLVTVLDVSGSMSGTKLDLLKRAMRFVIQNLGPSDRLSVITFASTATRLFPLRKMTASGQEQALQAVDSLVATGGTNIAEGLWKAARVMEDRQAMNPVSSIILLSDGVDTHTLFPRDGAQPDYARLVPRSILPGGSGDHVPIHAFGFGHDHDSRAMHAVAEMSNGTFSFIDVARSIQDAFAQCIGGLLSVVVQDARVLIDCADDGVLVTSIKSGGYASGVAADGRGGFVDVGRLYADEERDFLVTVRVPPAARGGDGADMNMITTTTLIYARCSYRDVAAATETLWAVGGDTAVAVLRPASPVSAGEMSLQVEREWHRVHATEDMAAAQAAAEANDYARASSILEARRLALEALAPLASDQQTQALVAELQQMQERVLNQQRYEESGRAYMLSGLSSHSWQRATARGDSTELAGLVHTYQTPSMVDMLQRSHALLPEVAEALMSHGQSPTTTIPPSRSNRLRPFRPTKSFTGGRSS
ncbi:hypothetical protein U9M48_009399 [Paspalum notatum var. saurae]|uniref:Uncharacterized protein n=1 Tax=Paspalum notatum var. saurae TaxID=547442 RepID=A0AAQ3SSC9_PASNO